MRRLHFPLRNCLAILASGLLAAGGLSAAESAPPPPEEPVEMTVGSPPMVSDDTGTPGPGNWEINFVISGDIAKDSKSFDVPLLDINYGIGEKIQLKLEVPYVYGQFSEYDETGVRSTTTLRGIGNTNLGVKYRFYDNEESGLSLAVYPQFEFRTPGARLEDDGGAAATCTVIKVPLLLTREFDHVSFTADLGFEKSSEDSRADTFASFGVGTRLSDKLAILGEIAGQSLGRSDERRILMNVGLRGKISDSQLLVAAIGRDIRAGGDGQKHCYFTVAYQLLIERKK